MHKLKSLWEKPTETFELILSKDLNWFKTILFFSSNGTVFSYYLFKIKGFINVDSQNSTLVTILSIFTLGIMYGILSNIIVGLLIKIIGKLFNGTNDLKKIYNTLGWSYLPQTISVYFILVNILITRVFLSDTEITIKIILSFLMFIIIVLQGFISIWQIYLVFKGLKVAQNLDTQNTILNYVVAKAIFGIFYYFLIFPYM